MLDRFRAPDEQGAEERAWRVVRAALDERIPAPRPRRHARALVLAAAAVALVAAAASAPGRAVLGSVRDTVVGERHASPALFSLPAPGRLLVTSEAGAWVVQRDGSKRLLAGYRDASWSPHGLYLVAVRGNELVTLEQNGHVHWTLARRGVREPSWGGTRTDTRIAYVAGGGVRLVAGDGTDDRAICGAHDVVATAWRPGAARTLAYADATGRVVVLDTNGCTVVFRSAPLAALRALRWSADGSLLAAIGRDGVFLYGGAHRGWISTRSTTGIRDAAFAPTGHRLALVFARRVLVLDARRLAAQPRLVFAGAGPFETAAWSPDGAWLLVPWESADQWIFVRTGGRHRVLATSSIADQFGGSFPRVAGWCCPS